MLATVAGMKTAEDDEESEVSNMAEKTHVPLLLRMCDAPSDPDRGWTVEVYLSYAQKNRDDCLRHIEHCIKYGEATHGLALALLENGALVVEGERGCGKGKSLIDVIFQLIPEWQVAEQVCAILGR